jgi:hypothetical protein
MAKYKCIILGGSGDWDDRPGRNPGIGTVITAAKKAKEIRL